jgi:hypothetical protein
LKKAQAEGNKAEPKGKKGETKANKGETKEHLAVHTTKIPGEAVIVTIVPKQFTMTTTKLWSAMKATIAERAVKGAKIKSNTRYRYFEAFKKSTGPEEYSKLFLEDEAEKDTSSKPWEEPLSLENSAKNAQDPSASVPLAETGEGTAGAGAGKPETREEKALSALKEAEAEGNKADTQGNKADTKTKKAEPKAPPSVRSTSIPGEAVVVKIIPQEFTMTTNTG